MNPFDQAWAVLKDDENVVKAVPLVMGALGRGLGKWMKPKPRGIPGTGTLRAAPKRTPKTPPPKPVRSTRQTELGDSNPNSGLPGEIHHTQGPIEAVHGKHMNAESRSRINREGIQPFEDWGQMVDFGDGGKKIPLGSIGQIGPGRWTGDMELRHPDMPLHTSVTTNPSIAEGYARGKISGMETATEDIGNLGDREATMFGVRSNAMKRRQALDDSRRDKPHAIQGGNKTQFIEGGIKPEELYEFGNRQRETFVSRDKPDKLETVLDEFNAWQGKPDVSLSEERAGGVKNRHPRESHNFRTDTTADGATLADRNAENKIGHSENLVQRDSRINREMGGNMAPGNKRNTGDSAEIARAQEQATQDIRGQWQKREDLRQGRLQRDQDRMNKVGEFAPPTPTGTQTTLGQYTNQSTPAQNPPQQTQNPPQQITNIQPSTQPPAPAPWSPNARAEGFAKAFDKAWTLLKRQTTLGEHKGFEDAAFSPHGKVRYYHGTTKTPADHIMEQGLHPYLSLIGEGVFTAKDPGLAADYARGRGKERNEEPRVFGIRAGVREQQLPQQEGQVRRNEELGLRGGTKVRTFDEAIPREFLVPMDVPDDSYREKQKKLTEWARQQQ